MGEWLPNKRIQQQQQQKKEEYSQKENRVLGQDTEIDIFQNVTIRVLPINESVTYNDMHHVDGQWKEIMLEVRKNKAIS